MSKLSQSEYPTNILEENPFRDSKPRGGEPEGSDIIKYWIINFSRFYNKTVIFFF